MLNVRSEFDEARAWGELSALRRYEIATPSVSGPIIGIPSSAKCIHGPRSSLLVRIGGGLLKASREGLLARLAEEAPVQLAAPSATPAQHVQRITSWLEDEQQSGFLERSYVTATLLVAVSDDHAWTWLVSPHGLVHGTAAAVRFESTDLRYPVLRRLGLMKEPAVTFPGTDEMDKATSIFCVGTPHGYERIGADLCSRELVVALDRTSLPFGPLGQTSISLASLWQMDAAWKHGGPGLAVAVGHIGTEDLSLPDDWGVREAPWRTH